MKWSCETLIFPKLFLSSVSAAESSSALELCLFWGGTGLGILLPLELLISGASAAGHLLVRPFLILSSLSRRLPKRGMREDADAGPAA